jgi:glycosyltransferase involved in cell wall biosynthesis
MRKVVIASPVATQSGYGHHAREVISQLIEQRSSEWDIKLVSLPWGHTPFTYPMSDDLKSRIIPLPLTEQPDLWIQITVPTEFQAIGKINIGVTAGTEGDICPPEWIDKLNSMQMVIVPSEFTKMVFENTAAKHEKQILTNIQVIPEYFNETVYNGKYESLVTELNSIPEYFAFLTVGHWLQGGMGEDRKNISGVLYTFLDAFKNQKDQPALILKTSGATYSIMDRLDIEKKIKQTKNLFKKTDRLPNVYLIHGDLTDKEMNSLYMHPKVKAMYSLTKAEGFGRPLLEFSTTSKPIIAPHYSGQADFLKRDFISSVNGQLTAIHPSAQNEFLIGDAKWFTPDYGHAVHCLKDVKKEYKKWIELSKRQRFFAKSNFNKTAVSKVYENVLTKVDTLMEQIPKEVQLKLPTLNKVQLPKLQKV